MEKVMTNIETNKIKEKIASMIHEESDSASEHLQAFINGWNNAIKEILLIIEEN
jgi:hypothetical protein